MTTSGGNSKCRFTSTTTARSKFMKCRPSSPAMHPLRRWHGIWKIPTQLGRREGEDDMSAADIPLKAYGADGIAAGRWGDWHPDRTLRTLTFRPTKNPDREWVEYEI